ncbi:MAG TPA: ATP-binding protein [Methanoregulaceae archaeon]|nr:ATP-binding protein [Methanoregulaceae archaeon]
MARTFSFTIDAEIKNIPVIAEGLEGFLLDVGVNPEILPDIQLAIDEAVTNIIMHGYAGKPGTIVISCSVEDGTVRIGIRDHAPPFDPLSIKEPDVTAALEDRVVGGMGIFLIRKVMDTVSYEYVDGENVLRMEKKRN